jgi:tetratricopeptide (TPR) repeat protein
MKIILLCSFYELSIPYNYEGLSTFNELVDEVIFFDTGLSKFTKELISSYITKPLIWYYHEFTYLSEMRNQLIKKSIKHKADFVIMIDDTYIINCPYIELKELIKSYDAVRISLRIHDLQLKPIKIFRPEKYIYKVRAHEVLCAVEFVNIIELPEIEILDIPDNKRSIERIPREIKLLNEDLDEYYNDFALRVHIYYYLGICYALIKEHTIANKYFEYILENTPENNFYRINSLKNIQVLGRT